MRKFFVAFALCVGIIAGGAARAENNCTGATYYDADTDTCVACPDGYDYNTDSGKTDITQCQIHCDAGTWVNGYTRLEYLQSTGTQYIDTGFYPNQNSRMIIDFYADRSEKSTVAYTGYSTAFGVSLSTNDVNNKMLVYTGAATGSMGGVWIITSVYENGTGRYLVDINKDTATVTASDGSVISHTYQRNSYQLTTTLYLFGGNRDDTLLQTASTIKIYNAKLYDNGAIVRDFIPVRRNRDGILGMYDTVTGTFFTNSGTGTFIAGSDTNANPCVNVGLGYYSSASTVNFGGVGARTACPAGTYSDIPNTSACTPCAGATYSDTVASTSCIACPAGYDYNTDPGKTSVTQCQIHCDVGAYVENEYTQLEYLQSTGYQYIDTGYKPNNNTNIKTKLFVGQNGKSPFGSRWSGSPNYDTYGAYIGNNGALTLYYGRYSSDKYLTINSFTKNVVHDVSFKTNNIVFDGVSYPIAMDDFNSTTNLYIGAFNDNGTASFPLVGRIYSFNITESNVTIRSLIPVRRNRDGILGMYDTVTGTFFTNAGTGEFIAGPYVGALGGECVNVGAGYWAAASTVNFGSFGTKNACPAGTYSDIENASACQPCAGATYNDKTAAASCIACPDGYDYNTDSGKTDITQCQIHCDGGTWNGKYTQLDYIESTGTQWIDTGVVADNTTEAEVDFMDFVGSSYLFFTTNGGWGSRNFGIIINDYLRFYMNCDGRTTYTRPSGTNVSGNIKLLTTGIFLNDTQLSTNSGQIPSSTAFTTTYPIVLFGGNYAGTPSAAATVKIRYFKLWKNHELVRNFIPARRNSDGVLGLYDMVTNTFFTNNGTGEFIAGPDVDGVIGGECVNVGAGYYAAASTVNFGDDGARNACPVGTTTVGYGHGADEATDCGRILHIGADTIYLRSDRKTAPSLNVKIGNDIFYGNMTTADVVMHDNTVRKLKIKLDNTIYSVYDDTVTLPIP